MAAPDRKTWKTQIDPATHRDASNHHAPQYISLFFCFDLPRTLVSLAHARRTCHTRAAAHAHAAIFLPHIDEKEHELPRNYHRNTLPLYPTEQKNYQLEYVHYDTTPAENLAFLLLEPAVTLHTTLPVLVQGLDDGIGKCPAFADGLGHQMATICDLSARFSRSDARPWVTASECPCGVMRWPSSLKVTLNAAVSRARVKRTLLLPGKWPTTERLAHGTKKRPRTPHLRKRRVSTP